MILVVVLRVVWVVCSEQLFQLFVRERFVLHSVGSAAP